LWGGILLLLGMTFFFRDKMILQSILPILLIGLGAYLLRDYFFKSKNKQPEWNNFSKRTDTPGFSNNLGETRFSTGEFEAEYKTQTRNWKARQ
jgi:hypothetical protein